MIGSPKFLQIRTSQLVSTYLIGAARDYRNVGKLRLEDFCLREKKAIILKLERIITVRELRARKKLPSKKISVRCIPLFVAQIIKPHFLLSSLVYNVMINLKIIKF